MEDQAESGWLTIREAGQTLEEPAQWTGLEVGHGAQNHPAEGGRKAGSKAKRSETGGV